MRGRPTGNFNHAPAPRDSDASFASSRPSTVGVSRPSVVDHYSDRSKQSDALQFINGFLSEHSNIALPSKPSQIPSQKEISEAFKLLLSLLGFPITKIDDDLYNLLRGLGCPFKVNKSALKAPNTPHNWPNCLSVINWLVQIAKYSDHLSKNGSDSFSFATSDSMNRYALESYMHFICGEDDLVEALDMQFMEKLEKERENVAEMINNMEKNYQELGAMAENLRTGPTDRESMEKKKSELEEDVIKFHQIIEQYTSRMEDVEGILENKEKELRAKEEERMRICEENEELKKRVEVQTFNSRDVERMKRELQAVERDIGQAEASRNSWEDKSWDIASTIRHEFEKLQERAMECNQATRRLKLGNHFQYVLNSNGSTLGELMGIDYKSTIKPELEAYAEKVRETYKQKLDDFIIIQQQSQDMAAKIEEKKNRIAALQSRIDEVEAQMNLLKKEMQDYTYKFEAEARSMVEDVQIEAHNLDIVEREAAEVFKAAELKLQEAMKQCEEELQKNACELIAMVDSVSKYKEYTESKISEMRTKVSDAAAAVSDAYKSFSPAQVGAIADSNQ